jgi:hypothetical protein
MTELENLKIELFNLVERVSTLSTQNEGTFTFTKEQLLSYSKFLINEAVENITTGIKSEINEELLDESIEIGIGYNREIEITIDERAFQHQIISVVEESVANEDIEDSVISALGHIGYTFEDRPLPGI